MDDSTRKSLLTAEIRVFMDQTGIVLNNVDLGQLTLQDLSEVLRSLRDMSRSLGGAKNR